MSDKSTTLTPEQHTNRLMEAVDRELDRYGAVSLADFCASTISGRVDDERDDYAYWSDVHTVFEAAREQLLALDRRHRRQQGAGGGARL